MQIHLSPIRSDDTLSLTVDDQTAAINGRSYDLSALPDGARLPASALDCPAIAGPITRVDGMLCLPLILPHGIDAGDDVRFPPVPCAPDQVPGLTDWQGEVTPGVIDWGQMQTAEQIATARLEEWRDTRTISRLELCMALATAGLISPTSMIAAAGGEIPAEFAAVVNEMPDALQSEVRARWAGAADIGRRNPFILMVQQAAGLTDAQVDALFGAA